VQAAIGKGHRTGEAPHEVLSGTLVVSSSLVESAYWDVRRVHGSRYGLPRKSVGSLRYGQGSEISMNARARADTSASCGLRRCPAAAPHPWIERDPASGARSLRLSPPQTARRLADALLVIVDSRRGTRAGE
jgi:hypothetical protein